MTRQPVHVYVMREGYITIWTMDGLATPAAQKYPVKPPAVQKEDGLISVSKILFQFIFKYVA
jgi:hypothetical protein